MKIQVTAEDIARGIRRSHSRCPIALALFRLTGRGWDVDGEYARNDDGGRVAMPGEAHLFVLNFDRGLEVEPFAFEVHDVHAEG